MQIPFRRYRVSYNGLATYKVEEQIVRQNWLTGKCRRVWVTSMSHYDSYGEAYKAIFNTKEKAVACAERLKILNKEMRKEARATWVVVWP